MVHEPSCERIEDTVLAVCVSTNKHDQSTGGILYLSVLFNCVAVNSALAWWGRYLVE